MNETQQNTLALGNTKPELRARGWFLTLWNFTDEDVLTRKTQITGRMIIGAETCPTTQRPHHHVYIYSHNAIKFSTLKAVWGEGHDFKVAKGSPKHNLKYLSKQHLLYNDWPEIQPEFEYNGQDLPLPSDLYEWQKDLIERLERPPDKRTILWYYDEIGNSGKSTFGKYLAYHKRNICLLTATKSADILTAVDPIYNTYILDFPRTLGPDFCPFTAIEQVKNGFITDSKLKKKARTLMFNPPHVLIFSNFPPKRSTMSADRWSVFDIYHNTWET